MRLDDYSTTNWYMVDSKLMKRFNLWVDRVKPQTKTWFDDDTMMLKQSIYFRLGYGFTNWRWIYGNQVS
jgi:hypothetical protein